MLCSPAVAFGLLMAVIDVLVLSMLKMRHTGQLTGDWVFIVAFLVYGSQTIIFYKALSYANLTIMNILWDLTSDVLVTLIGLYYFKEATTFKQKIGIVLGATAMLLLK
jgi:multidrug transporter EmrE-like cation transporter